MIFILNKLLSLRRLVGLWLLLVSPWLVGCADNNSADDTAIGAQSGIGLGQAPEILSRAVDPVQLRPIVTMNGITVTAERASDGSWFVDYILFDSILQIEMRWVENYNEQDLVLASWSGSFANITSNSAFTIPVEDYLTDQHDNDSDGVSNLDERIAESDPYTAPFSADDIVDVWITSCEPSPDLSFESQQFSVTFGPTSYQLSTVSYLTSADCAGTNYVVINVFGSYEVTDGVTVLADGDANHFDITFRNADVSAGEEINDTLASQGITLQEALADTPGYENINDISLETLGFPEKMYSIYRIVSNRFFTGVETELRDGSSPALRHDKLDQDGAFSRI